MAMGSQIFKANINLANLNTNVYEDVSLTMALHPSETEERMMYRMLAFLYCTHERLEFSKGLDDPEQPDIWQKDLMGDIEHWIDLGLPEEKRIKKATGRSNLVSVFTYSPSKAETWFTKIQSKLKNNKKLQIYHLIEIEPDSLTSLVQKTMNLSCIVEDGQIFLSNEDLRVQIDIKKASL